MFVKKRSFRFVGIAIICCMLVGCCVAYINRTAIKRLVENCVQYVHHQKLENALHKTADMAYLKSLNIPVVVIDTKNNKEPSFDEAVSPTDWGKGIKNAKYVKMDVKMLLHDSLIYCNRDETGKRINESKIRIRGNTSAYDDKKSYMIKFNKKSKLLIGKSKKWILLRTVGDIKTIIGFETNRLLSMPYTPRYQYVNLVVNNNYRGLYVLLEPIGKNKVGVSDNGYIIEADAYWWNEDYYFKTELLDDHFGYTFKHPSYKNADSASIAYIKDYVRKFEKSIGTGQYEHYIDVRSWVSWLMVHDILGTRDYGGSNIYLSKYDQTDSTLLQMPTTWDFDCLYKSEDLWAPIHEKGFYFQHLLNSPNTTFKDTYDAVYKEKSSVFFPKMDDYLLQLQSSHLGSSLDASLKLDAERWDYPYKPLRTIISEAREWFSERKKWMDAQLKKQ